MEVTKPYKFIGFGDINGPNPYEFIGFGDIHGPNPFESPSFGPCRIFSAKTNRTDTADPPLWLEPGA